MKMKDWFDWRLLGIPVVIIMLIVLVKVPMSMPTYIDTFEFVIQDQYTDKDDTAVIIGNLVMPIGDTKYVTEAYNCKYGIVTLNDNKIVYDGFNIDDTIQLKIYKNFLGNYKYEL